MNETWNLEYFHVRLASFSFCFDWKETVCETPQQYSFHPNRNHNSSIYSQAQWHKEPQPGIPRYLEQKLTMISMESYCCQARLSTGADVTDVSRNIDMVFRMSSEYITADKAITIRNINRCHFRERNVFSMD